MGWCVCIHGVRVHVCVSMDVIHGVRYMYVHVSLCYFSLRIPMNYTENVTELLTHARTVDTRRPSPPY